MFLKIGFSSNRCLRLILDNGIFQVIQIINGSKSICQTLVIQTKVKNCIFFDINYKSSDYAFFIEFKKLPNFTMAYLSETFIREKEKKLKQQMCSDIYIGYSVSLSL